MQGFIMPTAVLKRQIVHVHRPHVCVLDYGDIKSPTKWDMIIGISTYTVKIALLNVTRSDTQHNYGSEQ